MGLRNTRGAWGWPARLLHWAMAVLVVAMIGIGLWSARGFGVEWDDLMARKALAQFHKSLGATVFALACLRLIWRALNPVPAPPEGVGEGVRLLARAGHAGLYVLMFAVPMAGWLYASASPLNNPDAYPEPIANEVWGLFALPDPYPVGDRATSDLWHLVHLMLGLALAGLIVVHALAALWHHFVRRDGVLTRMLTGRDRG